MYLLKMKYGTALPSGEITAKYISEQVFDTLEEANLALQIIKEDPTFISARIYNEEGNLIIN